MCSWRGSISHKLTFYGAFKPGLSVCLESVFYSGVCEQVLKHGHSQYRRFSNGSMTGDGPHCKDDQGFSFVVCCLFPSSASYIAPPQDSRGICHLYGFVHLRVVWKPTATHWMIQFSPQLKVYCNKYHLFMCRWFWLKGSTKNRYILKTSKQKNFNALEVTAK